MVFHHRSWIGALAPSLLAALFICGATLRLASAADSTTIDFPIKSPPEVPFGLATRPIQVTAPDGTGYAEFALVPVPEGEELFLTIIFRETGGAGPGIFWTDGTADNQVTISANLAEGVVGLNQRTIQLPSEVVTKTGRLVITGNQKNLLRARLDWIAPASVFVASDQEAPALISNGRVFSAQDVAAGEHLALPDAWFGDVLDAPLQDGVLALDGNVQFVVPLNRAPEQSLLRARFLGLPLSATVKVWINGHLAGRLQPMVPLLSDAGFVRLAGGRISYAGWRPGALLINDGLLKAGDNTIVLESPRKGGFVRDAALQVRVPLSAEPPAIEVEKSDPE